MKKLMLFALLVLGMGMSTANAQVVKQGNVFTIKSSRSGSVRDTVVTKYTFENSKGDKLPIILNRSNGVCYVYQVSKKTGKGYRRSFNHDNDIQISKDIAKEYGVNFTYVPRAKKSK